MKYNIFIVHPSRVLTDRRANGDGLLAYRYIRELARRGHRLSVVCETIDIAEPLPSGVTLYPITVARTNQFAHRAEYCVRMRRIFDRLHRREPFDIAHQLNPVFAGLSLGLAGTRVPIVLGPYVRYWPSEHRPGWRHLALDAISTLQQSQAQAIVLSGAAAAVRLSRWRRPNANIFTVPFGIDADAFSAQPLPDGAPVILFLAALTKRKGIFTLIQAFDSVAEQVPGVRLHIAGDGHERPEVEAAAARSAYRDRIAFLGPVPRERVAEAFAQSTVLCLPSVVEPYGMPIVEAMASGRAVVATAAGGPLDLVDPRGGTLVPPNDAPALATALTAVVATPGLAQRMGAYNRQAIVKYSWPAVIDRLEGVYDTVARPRFDAASRPHAVALPPGASWPSS